MGERTAIAWTDATWNVLRGCSRVSAGCRNCYAEKIAARFAAPGRPFAGVIKHGKWSGRVELVESALTLPLRWRKPRRIFVNSMSDLFHESVPDAWIDRIFCVMGLAQGHTFQILTKRPARIRAYLEEVGNERDMERWARWSDIAGSPCAAGMFDELEWPLPNVWCGVSVENEATAAERIPLLLQTPAAIRWVSVEPLLGPVDLSEYMGYNPMYESEIPRARSLRSRETRTAGDRTRRNCVETRRDAREPMESSGVVPSSGAKTRGTQPGPIPPSQTNDQRVEMDVSRSSAGLDALLRGDTGRSADQSQERGQERQQARELGDCDSEREREARVSDRPERSARREEPRGDTDGCAGGGHAKDLCGRGRESGDARQSLRHILPASVPSSPWGQKAETSGASVGLHGEAATPEQAQRSQIGPISWCVIGGESGPQHRPMEVAWVEDVVRQCTRAGVAVFVKQDSGSWPGQHGRIPDALWARKEFPR